MTKKSKLITRVKSIPNDLKIDELDTLLVQLGFTELKKGKTGGSRVKYYDVETGILISLHKPHPSPILKKYMVKQVVEKLIDGGLI